MSKYINLTSSNSTVELSIGSLALLTLAEAFGLSLARTINVALFPVICSWTVTITLPALLTLSIPSLTSAILVLLEDQTKCFK